MTEVGYILGIVFLLLEYWLGKTEKVKAGSTVELVTNMVKYVWGFMIFMLLIVIPTYLRSKYGNREKRD